MRNAATARAVGDGLTVGADAARRILSRVDDGNPSCAAECWPVIVDLMHASQWVRIYESWTTYEELRRAGLPSDRRIIDAVETYKNMSARAASVLETPPRYRTVVRMLIPIVLQDLYWQYCFIEADGIETYRYPCPPPSSLPQIDAAVIGRILDDPELVPTLREWTSIARNTGAAQTTFLQDAAQDIASAIESGIGGSP